MFTGYYVKGIGVFKLVAVVPSPGSSTLTDSLVTWIKITLHTEVENPGWWFALSYDTVAQFAEEIQINVPQVYEEEEPDIDDDPNHHAIPDDEREPTEFDLMGPEDVRDYHDE